MSEKIQINLENNEEKDSSELTQEESDLYDLYINEYNDLFENVLNLKGKNLYSLIKHNVSLLMGKSKFSKYSKTSFKKVYNKLKEDYFEPDNIVIKYLEENLDKIKNKDLPILNIDTIFAHCNRCYESIHICGEPLYNYKYYDLIICLKCKMIYKKNMIRLFCNSCKEEYYSYIVKGSNYKNDFFPATWEKYHCFSFNYDQMCCPKCDAPLYYSELKNLLKCFKCKWTSKPDNVLWDCEICGEKFNSKIKEFVKYEIKPEINCVKYALINRINARPYVCKCCWENPINIKFFHPKCGGKYYLSYLQNKFAVVCSKCKMIQNPEDVKWECGKCKKYFMCDKMVVLESAIEKEKNFSAGNEMKNTYNTGFFMEKKKKYQKNLKDKEEKLKLLPYIMPALNLPAIFYFGLKEKRKSEESKVNKLNSAKQDAIKSIDKTIKNKTVVLQLISETERDYRSVSDLLCLLSLLDKTTGNTLVGKYNSIQNDSFSKARTNIMLKLPNSEKADFPNDYSDLSRYKSTIEKERQELNRYKESIHSCNSAIEIKKTMKNLKKVTQ